MTDTNHTLTIETETVSRPDEEIPVHIGGAKPDETVEFEASITDSAGCTWRSRAEFTADEKGTVTLGSQPPVSGSYEGVQSMGWLWSMAPDDEDQLVTELMHTDTTTGRLRASTGTQSTETEIERGFEGESIEKTAVSTDEFVGTIVEPERGGPHPGVVVLHGSSGHSPVFEAALLASHGFAAFALQYIGEADILPENIVEIPATYFDTAAEWFRGRDGVTDEPLGIVGHSRGGEIGLWLGAHSAWAGPVVSYAGSSVLWDTPSGDPAWLDRDGEPLPSVSGQGKPTLCDGQLDDAAGSTLDAATVPVERIDAPVLFLSGGRDPIWPAQRLAAMAIERLDEAGFQFPYDHLTEDEAGHFVTPPYLPKEHHLFGGTPAAMGRLDAKSWPRVLDYLRKRPVSNSI